MTGSMVPRLKVPLPVPVMPPLIVRVWSGVPVMLKVPLPEKFSVLRTTGELTFAVTVAAPPKQTLAPLVGGPAGFQLPDVDQLLFPPPPVQVKSQVCAVDRAATSVTRSSKTLEMPMVLTRRPPSRPLPARNPSPAASEGLDGRNPQPAASTRPSAPPAAAPSGMALAGERWRSPDPAIGHEGRGALRASPAPEARRATQACSRIREPTREGRRGAASLEPRSPAFRGAGSLPAARARAPPSRARPR